MLQWFCRVFSLQYLNFGEQAVAIVLKEVYIFVTRDGPSLSLPFPLPLPDPDPDPDPDPHPYPHTDTGSIYVCVCGWQRNCTQYFSG